MGAGSEDIGEIRGLTSEEAARLLAEVGPNEVAERRRNPVLAFLGRYWGPMPWLLELAMALALAVGHATEALVIFVLLTVNAVVGTVQSSTAAEAVRTLKDDLCVRVPTLRDGAWGEVESRLLVPGDVVSLSLGDVVPADGSVLSGACELDLSSLTGESLPREAGEGDEVPSGGVVVRGRVVARVTETGERTAYGRAAALVRDAAPRSRQQELLFLIVRYMMYVGVAASVAVAAWALVRGEGLVAVASLAVTFLMGAVPVALPAVLSIVQAAGATELSREGVLVTRLDSVEDAASIDVFCLDKTGTITRNALEVTDIVPLGGRSAEEVLRLALLASERTGGEAIDAAIVRAAAGRGVGRDGCRQLSYVPFDPSTKRTEALVELADGSRLVVAKGAPRTLFELAGGSAELGGVVADLSGRGRRAVCVGVRREGEEAIKLVGVLGLSDPPREDAAELIAEMGGLGIRCLMLTGDDVAIARTVAREVGIGDHILRASELRGLPEDEELRLVEECDGFAEVLPEDKHRIVSLLQRAGHSVGMTGDGVNDAPALRQAELGCAVEGACDVARASASAVLCEPGLAGIVSAVRESRRAYQRMLTWVINKVTKVMEVVVLFTAAYLLLGEMPVTLLGMSLLVFANDFATMSIASDHVVATDSPNAWDLRSIVAAASGLGALFALEDLAIELVALGPAGLGHEAAATLVMYALVVNSQVRLLLVRERGRLWASAPSRLVVCVAVLATAAFTAVAGLGWFVPAAPWPAVLATLAACTAGGLLVDRAKVALFRLFGVK